MREIRKSIDLPSANLGRADIEELAKLMIDAAPDRRGDPVYTEPTRFKFQIGDASETARSIDELLSRDWPNRIDELEFDVNGWTEDREIDRGITIRAGRMYSTAQIHSVDEIWFHGAIKQIRDFFGRRRTWYSRIRLLIPGIFFFAGLIALSYASYSAAQDRYFIAACLLMGCAVGLFLAVQSLRGQIFPSVRITLVQRPFLTERKFELAVAAIGAAATVVGVASDFLSKTSP